MYVRKSTEKGLELEFNSLQNQEEACKAYIMSQAFNEWHHYKTYTDGGISGGTMERPALKQMLDDISKGLVKTVLVYKVDRLSRSIMDFHNMMKDLEKYNCNFVSITQAFDTSTSMGKLTLNMLLSFAQFEREVSSERVRDKIYASKMKGFWMGGTPRLGYDIVDKKLIVNEVEAKLVKHIFETYLEMSSIRELTLYLRRHKVVNKKWITKDGIERGGTEFLGSSIHRVLRDHIYIGEVESRRTKEFFKGQHKPIIEQELFDKVQEKLSTHNYRNSSSCSASNNLLSGKLFDDKGEQFINQATSKSQKNHRKYYAIKGFYLHATQVDRFAKDVVNEALNIDINKIGTILKQINFKEMNYFNQKDFIKAFVKKVIYQEDKLTFFFNLNDENLNGFIQEDYINSSNETKEYIVDNVNNQIILEREFYFQKNMKSTKYNAGKTGLMSVTDNQQSIVRAFSYAWKFKQMYEECGNIKQIMQSEKANLRTVYRYLNLAYLSPNIINGFMNGKLNFDIRELFILASKYDNFKEQEHYLIEHNL